MEELNLRSIYTMFWRKKITILVVILISIILGAVYSYNIVKPSYESSTTFMFADALEGFRVIDNKTVQTESKLNSNLVDTYNELIKSKTSLNAVKTNLNIDINYNDLRDDILVERVDKTEVIKITVRNESPELACNIANEIVKVFSIKIHEISNMQNIYVIDKAVPEHIPYNVNHLRDIIIFAVIGIAVSIIILIVNVILDTTVKDSEDVEIELGLKNLNLIPFKKIDGKKKETNELIIHEEPKSHLLEAFNTLRTNIQFSNVNKKESKVLLVTSPFSAEGKSYVASNLAVAFANAGKKVVLIDTNMRNGRIAKIFNLPNELGLSNYLSNLDKNGMEINERVNKYINETAVKNLNVITSGNVPPNPSELLTSNRLPEVIKELTVFYDLVILDAASVLPTTDALILARLASSTLLVTLYNKTKKDEIVKAKKDIQNTGGRVIGTVINKVPMSNFESKNGSKLSFIKKYEIRRKIVKEEKEKKKNDFEGLNFERERKIKERNYRVILLKNKIRDFFKKFKKEETKLLDMSKESKEKYIKEQKRLRQEQIRKEKQEKKEQRKQVAKEIKKEEEKENVKVETEAEEKVEVKAEIKIEEAPVVEEKIVEEVSENIKEDNQLVLESFKMPEPPKIIKDESGIIKLSTENRIDEEIQKIEEKINNVKKEELKQEVKFEETVNSLENEEVKKTRNEVLNEKLEDLKKTFSKFKTEFVDLKDKIKTEYIVKIDEYKVKQEEKRNEMLAYNERKNKDKEERDALRREEMIQAKEIAAIEKQKQDLAREEERKIREAEKELKRKEREEERIKQNQAKLIQKGLREAERENRRKEKAALKKKQKEEARIKEEILEDNLYPKTKYNKDI